MSFFASYPSYGLPNLSQIALNGSVSGTLILTVPATVTSYTLTFPAAQGANGDVLTNNGSGQLAWTAAGGVTIGTIDSQTKAANGAVISGDTLVMQTADSTHVGLMSTGTQTIAGAKTFTSLFTANSGAASNVAAFKSSHANGPYVAIQNASGDIGYIGSGAAIFGGSVNDLDIDAASNNMHLGCGAVAITIDTSQKVSLTGDMELGGAHSSVAGLAMTKNTSTSQTLAAPNGSTLTYAVGAGTGAGLLVINDAVSGATAVVVLSSAASLFTLLSNPDSKYSVAAPGAGDTFIHITRSSGNMIITNETGSAATISVTYFRQA